LTLSKVMNLVKNDKLELAEAIAKVTEEAAKEAAKAAEAQAGLPGEAAGAMPGEQDPMAALGAGATMQSMAGGQPPISGPNPSQQNLGQLLNTLRKGSRSVA
jgi:hypothetical protein